VMLDVLIHHLGANLKPESNFFHVKPPYEKTCVAI